LTPPRIWPKILAKAPKELADIVLGPYESITLPPGGWEEPLVGIRHHDGRKERFEVHRERAGWAITVCGKTHHRASFSLRSVE